MCDLALVIQLDDLDAQVHTERQLFGALLAAGRWPEDEDGPSLQIARATFAERLNAPVEPARPPRQLTAAEQEQADLHQVLGVGRRGQ